MSIRAEQLVKRYDEQIETELTPPFAMTSDDPNTLYRPDTGDW